MRAQRMRRSQVRQPRGLAASHKEIARAAVSLAEKRVFAHLVVVADGRLPPEILRGRPGARRKLIYAVVSDAQRAMLAAEGEAVVPLPDFDLPRAEKVKLALVTALARGLVQEGDTLVALVARRPAQAPDSLLVVTVGEDEDDGAFGFVRAEGIPPEVLESIVALAVSVGVEGWEGRPVGALFVVGDASKVMEKSRQLSLNPFQGYSEDERNFLNHEVRDAVRAFAVLDGAFVIRDDGVVMAAGRYLSFDEGGDVRLPLGLGARHMAAAGISRDTDATAIVVSQTSGAVRIFRHGSVVLELAPRARRA